MSAWKSDGPISMPKPQEHSIMIGMYGFGYTQFGIAHDITEADYMNFRRNPGAPTVLPGETVRDDADLDNDVEFL